MRHLLGLVAVTVVFAGLSCGSGSDGDDDTLIIEDLLVRNNEITGWTYSGSGWTAGSISELTIYIDGKAEVYQRHGFVEAAYQAYQGSIASGTRTIALSVFNQGSAAGAIDTFNDPDVGLTGATAWPDGAGDAAHYVRYGGLSQALSFYRDQYFVLLEVNYDTDETLNIIKQFALNVDGKIK
jgi:hypothetical protein